MAWLRLNNFDYMKKPIKCKVTDNYSTDSRISQGDEASHVGAVNHVVANSMHSRTNVCLWILYDMLGLWWQCNRAELTNKRTQTVATSQQLPTPPPPI